jgi:toxin FitB
MIVLDTNVVSEAMSTSPNRAVAHWISSQSGAILFTTTVSAAEILYGIELLPAGKRRSALLASAEAVFARLFIARVLAFDEPAARVFPSIARRLRGRPITLFDAQIAAIVRVHDATLATRNISDFEGCGIRVVNPWVD